jgi:Effector-associated domain 2
VNHVDVHQTICVMDIAGYGGMERTRTNYVTIRNGLFLSVQQAFKEAEIPWNDCYHENTGDGRLILAPATVPKAHFAATLPNALHDALRQYNEERPAKETIKLRMALHAGEITYDEHGVAATAIIHACRLLDALPLKSALADSPGTLGMIASNWFFDDVIRHRPEHEPAAYHKIAVVVKETIDSGWIRLVGHELPAGALEPLANVAVVATPDLKPASREFYEVVDALEQIPCLQSEHSRTFILEQLTFAGAITYFPNRRAHLTSILRSCLDYDEGVSQLVLAVTNLESARSIPVKRLIALLTGEAV